MIKKTLFSLLLMLFSYILQAQSNEVEIYTEDAKLFTVYIDGVKMNQSPLSNVKFTTTKSDNLNFKIVFVENETPLEKKVDKMIAGNNRLVYTNGAKAVYVLKPANGSYDLIQTSVSNRTNNQQKSID